MKRLFVRPELCTGCKSCELACATEHSHSKTLFGAMLETPPPHTRLYVETGTPEAPDAFKMPMTCRHCDPAPCIAACIPLAMYRTRAGTVTNVGGPQTCIACGLCLMTCPFGMIGRGLSPEGKVMALKCDLCPDRDVPACVAACPTGALTFTEGDAFAQDGRRRAVAVLAEARQLRDTTLLTAKEN